MSRVSPTFAVWAAATRGSAVGYDWKNGVYLVVSSGGTLYGRFTTADGAFLGEPFGIQASGNYAHFPRVAYSPDTDGGLGGFLVTWHESDQNPTSVHCRMVSVNHGVIGGDTRIAGSASYWEVGAAVAYSTASQEFLIAWRSFSPGDIYAARVNNSGTQVGSMFPISTSPAHEDHPNIAYNTHHNEFLVVYSAFTSFSTLSAQRVQPGTGQLMAPPTTLAQSVGIYITDVASNPGTNQYLAMWHQEAPARALYGRVLNADGSPAGDVAVLSSRYRAYDALSVAHNPVSGSFFAVSHDSLTSEDGGVEISGGGVPLSSGDQVTAVGGLGNFYPRVASHLTRPEWMVVAAASFNSTIAQRMQTATRPTVAPLISAPRMSVDFPQPNQTFNGTVAVGGWAIDLGDPSGGGVDVVHVWAFPASGGSPHFLGAVTPNFGRPDVAAAFGSSRFSGSGFNLTGSLPAGAYDLAVYAHSAVSGTFNNAQVVRINVTAPLSIPRMALDLPVLHQNISQIFTVAGWAIDLGSSAGSGVDAVHVWAFPATGAPPTFLGAALTGGMRPDVGGAFGSGRFSPSGFSLGVVGAIPPGVYDIAVYAHSSVANSFNNASVVRVTVR
jgi:hypothetical protein